MSEMNELPMGWCNAILENVLDYLQPTKYIVETVDYRDSYKTPVLTAGKSFILGKTNETKGIFTDLPVIIFDDFTTAIKFVNFQFKVKSSAMKILKPTTKYVNIHYVFYFMKTLRITIDTHKRYWISHFSQLGIPFPPLSEQQRIVAKIEELFSSLEKGIENLKTAQGQLKVYRQSVLKWAFEGKLTNKNVNDGELPEGWTWTTLNAICEIKRGKSKHRPRDDKLLFGGNYPFIQTGDVRGANGGIIRKYSQTYNEIGLDQSKLWPKNTLCLTIAANIGETAFLGFDACFPDSVVGIIAYEKKSDIKYLSFYIQRIKQELDSKASATAQKNINVEFLNKVRFPICSITEQQAIVSEIETRLSVCDKLEESIEQSLLQTESGICQDSFRKVFSETC